jgi:ABC-type molybdate transport system substrate-binding protein
MAHKPIASRLFAGLLAVSAAAPAEEVRVLSAAALQSFFKESGAEFQRASRERNRRQATPIRRPGKAAGV